MFLKSLKLFWNSIFHNMRSCMYHYSNWLPYFPLWQLRLQNRNKFRNIILFSSTDTDQQPSYEYGMGTEGRPEERTCLFNSWSQEWYAAASTATKNQQLRAKITIITAVFRGRRLPIPFWMVTRQRLKEAEIVLKETFKIHQKMRIK